MRNKKLFRLVVPIVFVCCFTACNGRQSSDLSIPNSQESVSLDEQTGPVTSTEHTDAQTSTEQTDTQAAAELTVNKPTSKTSQSDFANYLWGMSVEEVMKSENLNIDDFIDKGYGYGYLQKESKAFDEPCSILFFFTNDILTNIMYVFVPESNQIGLYHAFYKQIETEYGLADHSDFERYDDRSSYTLNDLSDDEMMKIINDKNGACFSQWQNDTNKCALILTAESGIFDYGSPIIMMTIDPLEPEK